jgi:hypothetical protein
VREKAQSGERRTYPKTYRPVRYSCASGQQIQGRWRMTRGAGSLEQELAVNRIKRQHASGELGQRAP